MIRPRLLLNVTNREKHTNILVHGRQQHTWSCVASITRFLSDNRVLRLYWSTRVKRRANKLSCRFHCLPAVFYLPKFIVSLVRLVCFVADYHRQTVVKKALSWDPGNFHLYFINKTPIECVIYTLRVIYVFKFFYF